MDIDHHFAALPYNSLLGAGTEQQVSVPRIWLPDLLESTKFQGVVLIHPMPTARDKTIGKTASEFVVRSKP
jgi:hypothetical protein